MKKDYSMVGCLYVCLCLNTGVVSEQCVVTRVEKEVLDVVPLGLRVSPLLRLVNLRSDLCKRCGLRKLDPLEVHGTRTE